MSDSREHPGAAGGTIEGVDLDFEWCYRAVDSRDSRFDGWFYTAVTSTGIYCRPSCPARTPHRRNVRFYRSAAAAQGAGFRACRRCRPDAVPGSPEWNTRADAVGRAMRLIADGVVDRDGVPGLARRLGYTERHLHRMLAAEVGAGPLALARAQRAQAARTLIEGTDLDLAEIAFAAGFGSVRQFNDTVRQAYGVPPSQLRRSVHRPAGGGTERLSRGGAGADRPAAGETVTLRLAYRPPLAAQHLLDFLAARAIGGVEEVRAGAYRRALRAPHGVAEVALTPREGYVAATLHLSDVRDLAPVVARCRRLLDLDADPVAVDAVLRADPALAPHVTKLPGVRVAGAVDGFEVAVRAVVGQQISVSGARTVIGRLLAHAPTLGAEDGGSGTAAGGPGLRSFPDAATVLALPDAAFGMPARRRETLRAVAAAVADGTLDLDPGADRAETAARLRGLPGIGAWTAGYIALRALADPDVFLPTDLGTRRGAATLGLPDDPAALAAHAAARWAPWRSYAVVRLWSPEPDRRPTDTPST
jgi:AraC family transcriptional regulator of adaptative response / DNA-3-methyladenine glycosylase II